MLNWPMGMLEGWCDCCQYRLDGPNVLLLYCRDSMTKHPTLLASHSQTLTPSTTDVKWQLWTIRGCTTQTHQDSFISTFQTHDDDKKDRNSRLIGTSLPGYYPPTHSPSWLGNVSLFLHSGWIHPVSLILQCITSVSYVICISHLLQGACWNTFCNYSCVRDLLYQSLPGVPGIFWTHSESVRSGVWEHKMMSRSWPLETAPQFYKILANLILPSTPHSCQPLIPFTPLLIRNLSTSALKCSKTQY